MASMIIGSIITLILAAVAAFVLPFVFLFSFFSFFSFLVFSTRSMGFFSFRLATTRHRWFEAVRSLCDHHCVQSGRQVGADWRRLGAYKSITASEDCLARLRCHGRFSPADRVEGFLIPCRLVAWSSYSRLPVPTAAAGPRFAKACISPSTCPALVCCDSRRHDGRRTARRILCSLGRGFRPSRSEHQELP